MADLAKEEGEKAMKELEKEFGVGKVCFVHLDVRDQEMWKAAWDEAEKFFGGQVQVDYFTIHEKKLISIKEEAKVKWSFDRIDF